MTEQQLIAELETLVDANGMQKTLQALYSMCTEKAAHVESTWQDRDMARAWTKGANTLNKAIAFDSWPL